LDYRVAPHKFPAALEDALEAYKFYSMMYDEIILVGDSAGGNLALALSLKLKELNLKLPKGIVLMSPWTDMAAEGESYQKNMYIDHFFSVDKNLPYNKNLLFKTSYAYGDLKNPLLSPKYADFGNYFCPTLIQVGGDECILDDSVSIHDKLKKISKSQLHIFPGMFHDF
jgi:acetyl esterase/lipase